MLMDEFSRSASVTYFHGLPGSPEELELLEHKAEVTPEVLDPLDIGALEQRDESQAPAKVIGFSLGAFSALKLAISRPESVAQLVLISPAGPLEMGPYLEQMAGAPIFRTAKANSIAFALLTAAQALVAHVSPRFLLKQMFANSCEAERALMNNPKAVQCLIRGLKHSLWEAAPLYRQTISEFVQPWEAELSKIQCPCQVYHGELDDWVPIEMARALFDRLPEGSLFQKEDGLGHYSTLIRVLPTVLKGSITPRQQ